MSAVIQASTICDVLSKAIKSGIIDENDRSSIFYDLNFIERKITVLKDNFPDNTLHAIAIKANPLPSILKNIKNFDVGLEAASIGEVYLALKCGYDPQKIVFDSPAKTAKDLEFALKKGIHINVDSFHELDRIIQLKKAFKSKSLIGLRINPQVGKGFIESTSVADKYSKFGVPLREGKNKIQDYFKKYSWLSGLHYHVGSQGIAIDQLIESSKRILLLATKIGTQIKWIDIGGGLSVNYSGTEKPSQIGLYLKRLHQDCPQLFTGSYRIITEFGRAIYANAGWTASRVEYVKSDYKRTAIINVGADLFLRESYQPGIWPHIFSVADKKGRLKNNVTTEKIIIAGPLCFSGDILAHEISLPVVKQDDYILIHDSGAYNLSMWSRYNSRLFPKVIGYRNNGSHFEILKDKENLDELYDFWV